MIENKKVISRSLIVLFLSLSIVYSLVYQKKMYLFKSSIKTGNEITNQTGIKNQNLGSTTQDSPNLDKESQDVKITNFVSLGDVQPSGVSNSNIQGQNSVNMVYANNGTLPGTTEYFGTLDIVSILGQKPELTLQDSKGNYFVYYGDHLDFAQTVKTLGGNIYEMVTESEILQNQLFGDRVSYINLSSFKDIRVLMVIEIDGDVWLLQIPSDKYHQSKDYLKSLFIH